MISSVSEFLTYRSFDNLSSYGETPMYLPKIRKCIIGPKGEDSGADVPSTEKFRDREQIHARTAEGKYFFKERRTKKSRTIKDTFLGAIVL